MLVNWLNGEIIHVEDDLTESEIKDKLSQVYPPARNYKIVVAKADDEHWLGMMVPDQQCTPKETRRVEERLQRAWYHDPRTFDDRMNSVNSNQPPCFQRFRNALIRSHAVVTGGAIVSAFVPEFRLHNLDIVVEERHAAQLLLELLALEYQVDEPDFSIGVNKAGTRFQLNCRTLSFVKRRPVDLIVIQNDRKVDAELSCCASWWDGRSVFSNDLHGLRNGSIASTNMSKNDSQTERINCDLT